MIFGNNSQSAPLNNSAMTNGDNPAPTSENLLPSNPPAMTSNFNTSPAPANPMPSPPIPSTPSLSQSTIPPLPNLPSTNDNNSPQVGGETDLMDLKKDALEHLSPLVDQLEQSPEEKFRTTMMMIQATDDQSLLRGAYQTALQISDAKEKAQALLDIVNEINYFTHPDEK